jgi:hypothetical protein
MKAFRIQNDIVAARDEAEAIKTWAEHYERPFNSAGPVEELDPETTEISIEDENEQWRDGLLSELIPEGDGKPEIIAFGECEDCG